MTLDEALAIERDMAGSGLVRNPACRITCVEACPENIPALTANVGHFASVIHAACSYETRELALLNSVASEVVASTGGSIVVPVGGEGTPDNRYLLDCRPLPKITLEDVMSRQRAEVIDILKLDCEGSEFDILANTTVLDRVRLIVGEWHGFARWEALRKEKFAGWDYGIMRGGEFGVFHLVNPRFVN